MILDMFGGGGYHALPDKVEAALRPFRRAGRVDNVEHGEVPGGTGYVIRFDSSETDADLIFARLPPWSKSAPGRKAWDTKNIIRGDAYRLLRAQERAKLDASVAQAIANEWEAILGIKAGTRVAGLDERLAELERLDSDPAPGDPA